MATPAWIDLDVGLITDYMSDRLDAKMEPYNPDALRQYVEMKLGVTKQYRQVKKKKKTRTTTRTVDSWVTVFLQRNNFR